MAVGGLVGGRILSGWLARYLKQLDDVLYDFMTKCLTADKKMSII